MDDIKLTNFVRARRCMDGTEPSFYYRQGIGAGADRWLIKLEVSLLQQLATDCMVTRPSPLSLPLCAKGRRLVHNPEGVL